MAHALRKIGKKWLTYAVAMNAGNNGEATKVRFSPRDFWVGNDYWSFVREYTPNDKDRGLRAMSRFEYQKRTTCLWYRIAQFHAVQAVASVATAQQNFNLLREQDFDHST